MTNIDAETVTQLEAAAERGITLSKDEAREIVYGMPYKEWQARHQTEATEEARAKFADNGGRAHKV